jgi:hypothetical protein
VGAPREIPLLVGLVDLSSRARIERPRLAESVTHPNGTRLQVGRSTTLVYALRDELRHCTTANFAGVHRGLTPDRGPVK